MNLSKRDRFLGVVCLATVLVLGTEGWFLVQTIQRARQARAGLETIRLERDAFQRQTVPPSEASERAIVQELAGLQLRLAAAQTILNGPASREDSPPPTKPIEGFFDVANFVEKTRALATQARVTIKPDERFGFASHASDGPAIELLAAVHAQRRAVQYLLGILFEAQPNALLSVQRERPSPRAHLAARAETRSGSAQVPKLKSGHDDPADFFDMPPSLSLRVPGVLDADGFALEFSGPTRSLREFMNRLATGEYSLFVRSVEVERSNDVTLPSGGSHSGSDATIIPIVAQSVSRFHVIVELVKPWADIEGGEK